METLESILAGHPFFEGLDTRWIARIATYAYNQHFETGDFIFHEGEEARHVYLLREGSVSLEMPCTDRGPVRLQTMQAGDLLGWSWLFPPHRWRFDARVIEWTRTIALDAGSLRSLCETDTAMGYELMKRFAAIIIQRLQATRMQYTESLCQPKK